MWDSCSGWFCLSACVRASTRRITPKYQSTEAPCRQRLGRAADAQKQSERKTVGKLCIFLQPVFRCKIVLYIPLDLLWHLCLFLFLHFSFEHFRCYGCLKDEKMKEMKEYSEKQRLRLASSRCFGFPNNLNRNNVGSWKPVGQLELWCVVWLFFCLFLNGDSILSYFKMFLVFLHIILFLICVNLNPKN